VGDIERLLRSLKVSDPELLFRAIALDHATRDLTTEALSKVEQLARANQDAKHGAASYENPHDRSTKLAAQDHPGAGGTFMPSAPTAENPQADAISARSPDPRLQPRDPRRLRHQPTPAAG
jgi:hypothetical protein